MGSVLSVKGALNVVDYSLYYYLCFPARPRFQQRLFQTCILGMFTAAKKYFLLLWEILAYSSDKAGLALLSGRHDSSVSCPSGNLNVVIRGFMRILKMDVFLFHQSRTDVSCITMALLPLQKNTIKMYSTQALKEAWIVDMFSTIAVMGGFVKEHVMNFEQCRSWMVSSYGLPFRIAEHTELCSLF